MKKKPAVLIFLLLACVLLFVVYRQSADSPTDETQPATQSEAEQQSAEEPTPSDFPTQNFAFIHPSSAGGGNDIYARGFTDVWRKYLPEGIFAVVEPKPGGGNKLGANYIYTADPDGYTLGLFAIPGLVGSQIVEETEFDLTKVEWLGATDVNPRLIAVSSKMGVNTVEELQNYDKDIIVATSGITGTSGVTTILVFDELGISKWRPINLPGTAEAVTAVLRGDANVLNFNVASLLPHIEAGDIIPLFVIGAEERLAELPDIPTFTEMGYPIGAYLADIRAIGAAPGIPEYRLQIIKDTMWQALEDTAFHEWGKSVNITTEVLNAEDTKKAINALFDVFTEKKDLLARYITQ